MSQTAPPNGTRRQDGKVNNAAPSTTSMRNEWTSPGQVRVTTSQLASVRFDIPVICIDVQITM